MNAEIAQLVKDEVEKAVKSEISRGNGVSSKEVVGQLEDVHAALKNIAAYEKKSASRAAWSAFASFLLLLAFIAVFVLLTPGVRDLLNNLNGTMNSVAGTVEQVNTLVGTADETVKGLNGVVSDVGTGVNGTFEEVNGLLVNVSNKVDGIGSAVDSMNEAVGRKCQERL